MKVKIEVGQIWFRPDLDPREIIKISNSNAIRRIIRTGEESCFAYLDEDGYATSLFNEIKGGRWHYYWGDNIICVCGAKRNDCPQHKFAQIKL